ncbi:flagella basal body P-ring formation protein FlgA [Alphaproteobacteria bacterium]
MSKDLCNSGKVGGVFVSLFFGLLLVVLPQGVAFAMNLEEIKVYAKKELQINGKSADIALYSQSPHLKYLENHEDLSLVFAKLLQANKVLLMIEDSEGRQYELNGTIKQISEVIASKRDIGVGEVLNPEDFYIATLPEVNKNCTYLTQTDLEKFATNKKIVRRKLFANKPVRTSDIEAELVIRRGQVVTLQLHKHNLTIETTGVCLEPGSVGSTIKVKNQDSSKVLQGVVVSEGVVSVLNK